MKAHLTATGRHLPLGLRALPTTGRQRTRPALIPARHAGTRFTYPGGIEG